MPLQAATRLGPYEILSAIGAGGMGEVYRAKDTRLDRVVAIKILPEHISNQPQARERFEREARAISSLSHPHICPLYDVGHQDGIDFLVMEFLEGETLASRLQKGPLPLDQVLKYGVQIADALDTAHKRGVIHRDLKPGNIMLTKSGTKLLDFGLAKLQAVEAVAGMTALPTLTTPLTGEGAILGTLQYMAPEQLEGQEADARTDIFALGAVLYEMATGRRAFDGKSQASLISAIMSAEPPAMSMSQPLIRDGLERVVKTCLLKDPGARWQSAHDLKLELTWLQQGVAPAAAAPKSRSREALAWVVAVLLLLTAVPLALDRFRSNPQAVQAVRSSLLPPTGSSFLRGNFSVSPDGTRLAFAAVGPDGGTRLWVRTFSASNAQQLNGTEGGMLPFWSPDSRRIGFFAAGKLRTVDVETTAVRILCDAPMGRCGGTWNRDGTIVFAPSISGPLYRIQDTGGVPVAVTSIVRQGSGQSHRWPFFLPDGKHFLYFVDWSTPDDPQGDGVYVGSLDASAPKLVSSEAAGNVAFEAGHLLYGRDRSLRAQPFDPARLELSGNVVSLAEQELEQDPGFSHSEFSVSQNGVLVLQSLADSTSTLSWFDSTGKELGQIAGSGYRDPRLSPDGRVLAVSSDDGRNGRFFVRIYDLARGSSTRLTDGGSDESPAWSHDGRKIAYGTFDGKSHYLKEVPVDGSGSPQLLLTGSTMRHLDWSPDGHLVFSDFSNGRPSVRVYSAADHNVKIFVTIGAEARFSPDGKWIAYTGPEAVFVQPFPGPGGRIEISSGTGAQPVWARDGRQIFYIAPDSKLMAASFNPQEKSAGAPRMLFQTRIIAPNFIGTQYDVSSDGRFLINSVPSNYSSPLTLFTGWTAQLKR
jgi:serine/threonine protein kinase